MPGSQDRQRRERGIPRDYCKLKFYLCRRVSWKSQHGVRQPSSVARRSRRMRARAHARIVLCPPPSLAPAIWRTVRLSFQRAQFRKYGLHPLLRILSRLRTERSLSNLPATERFAEGASSAISLRARELRTMRAGRRITRTAKGAHKNSDSSTRFDRANFALVKRVAGAAAIHTASCATRFSAKFVRGDLRRGPSAPRLFVRSVQVRSSLISGM
jgi:hypothetical protein